MTWLDKPFGKLMILIALYGHFLTHIPQPMHKFSEIWQIVEVLFTSIQSLPVLLTGHVLEHSYPHFLGLHLSGFMMAIRSFSSFSITIRCFSPIVRLVI